jgi:hypothetical protein
MSDEPVTDLAMLAALVRQVIAEQATTRDDLRVLTAIAMRQDNTLSALLTEVRAMHAQHARMDSRVRVLEARP